MFMKKNPSGTYSSDKGLWSDSVNTSNAIGHIALSRIVTTNLNTDTYKNSKPFLFAPNKRIRVVKSKIITLPSKRSPATPRMEFCLYTINTQKVDAVTK